MRESAHTRVHDFRVMIIVFFVNFFFSKISLLEQFETQIFSLNVPTVDRGVHGDQAIVFSCSILYISHGALHVDTERRHLLQTQHAQWGWVVYV